MSSIKRFFIPVTLYMVMFFLIGKYGVWWMILPFAFAVSYLMVTRKKVAFWLHFCLLFLLWTGMSIYQDSQVSGQVSLFLSNLAGNLPPIFYPVITGLIGGLTTGWAGFLGSFLRQIVYPKSLISVES